MSMPIYGNADTWPSLLGLVNVGVPEQYLWSIFTIVSAAVQNTWGPYNPVTWGEALVWTLGMVLVAVLFGVIVGFIVSAIKSSIRAKAKYKDMMDTVVVSSGQCTSDAQSLIASHLLLATKDSSFACLFH